MRYHVRIATLTYYNEKKFNRKDQVLAYIGEDLNSYTSKITVYDYTKGDFIYYKDNLTYDPEIDEL